MEGNNDIKGCLLHGCNLVRNLESNLLENLEISNPRAISQKCDEIIRVFVTARNHLNAPHNPNLQVDHHCAYEPEVAAMGVSYEYGCPQKEKEGNTSESLGHHGSFNSSLSSSSIHRRNPKKSRKDDKDANKQRVRVKVPEPLIGTMEVIPPDDGYTWRKYGQKEILRAKYPRSYYRCTFRKLYNCPATKQVQRVDDEPLTFEILYRGEHICHKASTAPTASPQPSQTNMSPHRPIATMQNHQWLLMDLPRPLLVHQGVDSVATQTVNQGFNRCFGSPGNYNTPAGSSIVGFQHHELDVADFLNQTMDEDFVGGNSNMEVIFPRADETRTT